MSEAVGAARVLLESEGAGALTMRRLAGRLGIQAPSLYKHIAGKEELEVRLIAAGLAEFGELLAAENDLSSMAGAYRSWAGSHPHLYALMTERPLPRKMLPAGLEASAARPLIELLGDPDLARAAWAAAHGLVSLEIAGRFPEDADLDLAWARMVGAFEGSAGS